MKLPFLTKESIVELTLDGLEIGAIVYNEGTYHTFALSKDHRKIVEFVSVELKNFTFSGVVVESFSELTLPTAVVRANKVYVFFNQSDKIKLTVRGKNGEWTQHPEPIVKNVGKVDVKISRINGEYYLATVGMNGEVKIYKSQNTMQWLLDDELLHGVVINGVRSASVIGLNDGLYLIYGKGNLAKCARIENGKLKKSVDLDDLSMPRTAFLLDGRTLLIGSKNGNAVLKEAFLDDKIALRAIREYDYQKEYNWTLSGLFVDKKGYLPDFKANKEYKMNIVFGSATECYLKLYSRYSQEVYVYVSKENGVVVCDATSVNGDGNTSRFLEIEDSVWLTYYQEGNILYVFVMGKAFTITLPEAVQGDTLITANGTLNCNIQVNDFNKETV